jgi:hypothetical protein
MAETLNFTLSAQDKTQAAFNSVNRSLSTLNKASISLKSAFAGIATASVFAGFVQGIQGAIDRASKFAETAQKIGASVEFLSAMSFAAKMSGVEFESLEKGMIKLSRAMDEVSSNAKSNIAYDFKRIGVSLTDANGQLKTTENLFLEIADKISGFDDGMRKAAVAQAIFGREGADLIPLLNEGADGIREMFEEAENLGVVFASQSAQALEGFGDDLDRIKFAGEGFFNILAANIIPSVSTFLDRIGDTANQTERASSKFSGLKSIAEGLATAFRYLAAGVYIIGQAFLEVGRDIISFVEAVGKALELDFAGAGEAIRNRIGQQVDFNTILKNATDIINNNSEANDGNTITVNKGTEALKANGKAAGELIDKYRALIDPGYEVLKQMAEFEKLAKGGAFTAEQFAIGMDRLRQKLIDARAETDPTAMAIKGLQGVVQNFADNASSAMAEFTLTGKADWKSMVNSMIKDLLTLYYKMTIFQPLANTMKSALSGAGSSGGGGLFGNLFGGFGDWISSLFKAKGGPVMGNSPYIVGERGPELFVPGGSGTIIPNNNLNAGGGESLVINQTINVSTGVQATVRAEIQSLMPQIANATKSAVLEARRRGGTFATAFGG